MACELRPKTSNALLYAFAKEVTRNSNVHRDESCARFDRSELKTEQSQVRSEAIHIVGLRSDLADVHVLERNP